MQKRFKGPVTTKYTYRSEFLVECPVCKQAAQVKLEGPWNLWSARLYCSNCGHTDKAENRARYTMTVKRHCDNCGEPTSFRSRKMKTDFQYMKTLCPNCGVIRTLKVSSEIDSETYPDSGKISDPVFHLPLWFQASVRNQVFWAWNRRHLQDIKEYVVATLRERRTSNFTTMAENLPAFIKSAKNRESVLKIIGKLEKK